MMLATIAGSVSGSRMRPWARRFLSAAFAAAAIVGAGDARATPEYPLVLDTVFGTECPQLTRCLICHTTARGGQSTARQPFATTLRRYGLARSEDGHELVYTYDRNHDRDGMAALLGELNRAGIAIEDLHTTQSSLEDIFVNLLRNET